MIVKIVVLLPEGRIRKMKKVIFISFVGLLLLMLGIYVSTFLDTHWVIIGTSLAIFGGFLIGGSSYFLPKTKK